jgi:transposase
MTKNIRHQSKMKFYSVDLRQKIINVYETEPISQRQLAQRFCVALSFVQKLLKQYRQTQDISPQTHRCSGPLKLTPEQLVIVAQLIDTNNDATLEELCELLHEKIGVTISRATMGRMTQRLKMTFKKKRSFRQIKAMREFKSCDMSSGNK